MKKEQTARYEIGKVKALIKDKIINCTTAILMYVEIKLAAGWTRKITAKEIYEELGISKASFHRAISKLRASNWILWTAPDETEFELSRGPKSIADYSGLRSETASQDCDDQTQSWNDQSQGCDGQTQDCNKQTLEPASSKASATSSTLSHLYSTYSQGTADKIVEQPVTANSQQSKRDPNHADPPTHANPPTHTDPGKPVGYWLNQILEETRRKLKEQVCLQADQRQKRGPTNALHVGTQGSYLTPDGSDQDTATSSIYQ
jgi:hypothetical protein